MTDEAYRQSAKVVYESLKRQSEFMRQMQAEYGKWIVSSILVLHSGAIGGLLYKFDLIKGSAGSLWWFVIGIALAIGTGFVAWLNFTFADESAHKMADHRMLNDPNYWPKEVPLLCGIKATLWGAVVLGWASVACLIGGAWSVWCHLPQT